MPWIVVTGPESTGKSTLSAQLAESYGGELVPEYARSYVENLKRPYTFSDVETIARRQLFTACKLKRAEYSTERLVFFDTFLILTKVWFEEVYACCPLWLDTAIRGNKPDLVLLCLPDLPWEADSVRENGTRRRYLLSRYQSNLEYYGIPFRKIAGKGSLRLSRAQKYINALIE